MLSHPFSPILPVYKTQQKRLQNGLEPEQCIARCRVIMVSHHVHSFDINTCMINKYFPVLLLGRGRGESESFKSNPGPCGRRGGCCLMKGGEYRKVFDSKRWQRASEDGMHWSDRLLLCAQSAAGALLSRSDITSLCFRPTHSPSFTFKTHTKAHVQS